jgi:hypothetical protein
MLDQAMETVEGRPQSFGGSGGWARSGRGATITMVVEGGRGKEGGQGWRRGRAGRVRATGGI